MYDMGRMLVVYAVSILDQDAQARGHIAGCNSIFLETLATSPAHFKVLIIIIMCKRRKRGKR